VSNAQRLRAREAENTRLTRLLAKAMLDNKRRLEGPHGEERLTPGDEPRGT